MGDLIFKDPTFFAMERMCPDVYLISVTSNDGTIKTIETSFVSGNIFINGKVSIGFDAPATFEIYYDCKINELNISVDELNNTVFLDIYVTTG